MYFVTIYGHKVRHVFGLAIRSMTVVATNWLSSWNPSGTQVVYRQSTRSYSWLWSGASGAIQVYIRAADYQPLVNQQKKAKTWLLHSFKGAA